MVLTGVKPFNENDRHIQLLTSLETQVTGVLYILLCMWNKSSVHRYMVSLHAGDGVSKIIYGVLHNCIMSYPYTQLEFSGIYFIVIHTYM